MHVLDWIVIGAYGAIVLWIGQRVGRNHQSSEELFLGGRRIPTWAALCSMVATELSAATFIGVPHAAYHSGSWAYLQYAFGSLLARIVLATWFISLYHRLKLVTVYGFLEQRFGRGSQLLSAWLFLVGRIFASGARLFMGALAFATATDMDMGPSILVAGGVAMIYTLSGGIRAVIFTDALQGAVFIIAAIASLIVLGMKGDGGIPGLLSQAADAHRTWVFSFPPLFGGVSAESAWIFLGDHLGGFADRFLAFHGGAPFIGALFGGFFLTMATHGTDQDMVQRLLTTKDGKRGGFALIASGVANFPLVLIFLTLGSALWAYYQSAPAYDISDHKRIFAIFVMHEMPTGLRGLIFAGLFAAAMSSLDSALNSLATTWVVDIRRNQVKTELEKVQSTRRATLAFGALIISAALICISWYRSLAGQVDLVGFALGSMTLVYGALLGAFLVALLTPGRGTNRSVIIGMVGGGIVGFALNLQPAFGFTPAAFAWPWTIVLGTLVSFGIGVIPRSPGRQAKQ